MKTIQKKAAVATNGKKTLAANGARITDAMPTGKGQLVEGAHIVLGIKEVTDYHIGTGVISQLDDYNFAAGGAYDFDIWGYKGSGTWSMSMSSTDGGQTYNVKLKFTGTWNQDNPPYSAAADEEGSGKHTTITFNGDGHDVIQSFQNDGWFQDAKVWYETTVNGHDVHLYIYNEDVYGS